MMPDNRPDYDGLAATTARFGLTPIELDALSWGRVVGGPSFEDERQLLEHFVTRDLPDDELCQLFDERLEANRAGLQLDEVRFLLPDDDAPMEKRLDAISVWCRTFLTSLGFSKYLKDEDTATKISALLIDCRAIGDLDPQSYRDYGTLEEAETGWTEIHEFLRVNIMLLYAELAAQDHADDGGDGNELPAE